VENSLNYYSCEFMVKRHLPGCHFIKNGAGCVDISSCINGLPTQLLRRHVAQCSLYLGRSYRRLCHGILAHHIDSSS